MIKVAGQALGEYGDMIIDHIEKKIAKEVGKLRTEVNLKRESEKEERSCSCRTRCASGADKLRPRGNGPSLSRGIPRKQSTSSFIASTILIGLYACSGHASAAQTGRMTCTRPQAESHTCAAQTGRAHDLHPTAS